MNNIIDRPSSADDSPRLFCFAIERLNVLPLDELRFEDFARLKMKDRLDSLTLGQLRALVPVSIMAHVSDSFRGEHELQAACLRWILRGLHTRKAVVKVEFDRAV